MSKTFGDVTDRLLRLTVGRSCVVNVRRPDRYIKTVRKYVPDSQWSVVTVDGGKIVTRVR
jgi:hypothetical protein